MAGLINPMTFINAYAPPDKLYAAVQEAVSSGKPLSWLLHDSLQNNETLYAWVMANRQTLRLLSVNREYIKANIDSLFNYIDIVLKVVQ